jgi:hypothetical protein
MNISNYLVNKNENDIPNIRKYLYKNYIKTVVENTNNNENVDNYVNECRMILIGNRFKSDFNNPISFECNGAIVSYNKNEKKWKTLVVPTELFNSHLIKEIHLNEF